MHSTTSPSSQKSFGSLRYRGDTNAVLMFASQACLLTQGTGE